MVGMRRSRLPVSKTWRVAVVPVKITGVDYRHAHDACHRAALLWNRLVTLFKGFWGTENRDPKQKELRHLMYGQAADLCLGLHAHTKQMLIDDLYEAVQTYRTNRNNGDEAARPPHREKNYRPLDFTAGYGWRETRDGRRIRLSFGKGYAPIILPKPTVTDPKTGEEIPSDEWGAIRLCWDINARQWSLHIAVPTDKARKGNPDITAAIDPGIINPMTVAVETGDAYEVLVINGRHARAVKHYRNTRIATLQEKMDRCVKGSKRWRQLDAKRKKIEARTAGALRNADHQTTRKAADFIQAHDAGTIVIGDVREIEKNTRKDEEKRCRNKKRQRRRLSQWSRGKQEDLLEHKTGVSLEHVNEAYSSQTCPACLTRNHPSGRGYHCRNCGFTCNRDAVGAINILMHSQYGEYKPIDTNKPIHVTYLRATPLFKKQREKHGVNPGTGALPLTLGA